MLEVPHDLQHLHEAEGPPPAKEWMRPKGAEQGARRKKASRLLSKVQYIKKQIDKVGWWEVMEEESDEETKESEDVAMEDTPSRRAVWVTDSLNLQRAKALAGFDRADVIDLC
ncbi:hypothetical protein PR002_g9870 [Phytophthora rubi]|uniref:Uncharacterized protein n=1 Tax=Phytophthora rubi TaxID=129364 RepID=A0A6A3MHZ0_9STRA|nr:hypothetical protein PR002_g9870 [Phytophthora rubi]